MELIIAIIGIGLSLILNVAAIAIFHNYVKDKQKRVLEQVYVANNHSFDMIVDLVVKEMEDLQKSNKATTRELKKLHAQLSKNRVDIMNEIYTTQAMIRDEGKKKRREINEFHQILPSKKFGAALPFGEGSKFEL